MVRMIFLVRCYARSWAKPGSIYILVVRQRMRTCHAGCAAYPYYLTCLGLVRQRAGNIELHIVVRGFPPYNMCTKYLQIDFVSWKVLYSIAFEARRTEPLLMSN